MGAAAAMAAGALVVDARDGEGGCEEGGPCVGVVRVDDTGVVVVVVVVEDVDEEKVDTGDCWREEAPS